MRSRRQGACRGAPEGPRGGVATPWRHRRGVSRLGGLAGGRWSGSERHQPSRTIAVRDRVGVPCARRQGLPGGVITPRGPAGCVLGVVAGVDQNQFRWIAASSDVAWVARGAGIDHGRVAPLGSRRVECGALVGDSLAGWARPVSCRGVAGVGCPSVGHGAGSGESEEPHGNEDEHEHVGDCDDPH
jgi:hypothetical protein